MKKNLFGTVVALMMWVAGSAQAEVDAKAAQKFVEEVTTQGIEQIINANVSQTEKDKRFEKLFNSALDLDFIGKFVLGRNWRSATPAQRQAFIKVYRELNIKTWSKRFDEFKGKSFTFVGTTPSSSKGQVYVDSTVDMGEAKPVSVKWRVRQEGSEYKIVDIVIENVSLAITARNEYSGFIKNNPGGVDALIKDLQNKVNQA